MSATQERPVTQVFSLLADLAFALGVRSIKDLPNTWSHAIDDQWHVCINAHGSDAICNHCRTRIPAFHAYLQFNGWPAGLLHPYGGTIAAGAVANEDALIEALKQAIAKAEQKKAAPWSKPWPGSPPKP